MVVTAEPVTDVDTTAADMLLGLTFQADRNLGEPFHNAVTFTSGYYFQDDWKISPKLTLNLGLRYDLDLPELERLTDVDRTLGDFYENALCQTRANIRIWEGRLRGWCEEELITPAGTRGIDIKSGDGCFFVAAPRSWTTTTK